MKAVIKVVSLAFNILLFASLLFIAYIQFFQTEDPLIQFKTVLTGSMAEKYPAGSLLVIKKVPMTQLELNDVITYRVNSEIVSHRIINKTHVNGQWYFETKGDNNNEPDAAPVVAADVIGKVIGGITCLGKFFLMIQTVAGKTALVLSVCQLFLLECFLNFLFVKEQEE